jgi:hypothetical protein
MENRRDAGSLRRYYANDLGSAMKLSPFQEEIDKSKGPVRVGGFFLFFLVPPEALSSYSVRRSLVVYS